MIDHVGIPVSDMARSKEFYSATLAPLGFTLAMDFGHAAGYARDNRPWFWLHEGGGSGGVHVAFTAAARGDVDAFHAAGLAAGGEDNGAPGLREYHPNYYAAYVHDPDGNNVEAVSHDAPEGR
ncbi:MAG TPA: VOC family protein [Gaiellaceae bacterium]|nr:VOC family protein [Gaiellaceae bacterium]